jgi:CheY-like chemotaxis protein
MNTTIDREKKRILVVDDNASDTHLLKSYLERTQKYVVREENDEELAVAAAEEFKPHMIILDVLMPRIRGSALADRFKAHPRFRDVPIVFLTCVVTKEEMEMCGGQIGEYPFVAKPIVLTEVAKCLKRHLG